MRMDCLTFTSNWWRMWLLPFIGKEHLREFGTTFNSERCRLPSHTHFGKQRILCNCVSDSTSHGRWRSSRSDRERPFASFLGAGRISSHYLWYFVFRWQKEVLCIVWFRNSRRIQMTEIVCMPAPIHFRSFEAQTVGFRNNGRIRQVPWMCRPKSNLLGGWWSNDYECWRPSRTWSVRSSAEENQMISTYRRSLLSSRVTHIKKILERCEGKCQCLSETFLFYDHREELSISLDVYKQGFRYSSILYSQFMAIVASTDISVFHQNLCTIVYHRRNTLSTKTSFEEKSVMESESWDMHIWRQVKR